MNGMSAAEHYTTAAHHAACALEIHRRLVRPSADEKAEGLPDRADELRQLELHLRFAEVHAQLAAARADGVQLAQLYSTGNPVAIRAEAEAWAAVVMGAPPPADDPDEQ